MKRIIAIAAIFMLVPFTALALQPMNDSALQDVTAQSGVSIDIDNIQLDFALEYLAWGDSDGIDGASSAGWVGINGLTMTNIVIDRLGVGDANIDPIAGAYNTGDATLASELVTEVTGGVETASAMVVIDGSSNSDLSYLTIDVGENYYSSNMSSVISGGTSTAYGTGHTCVAIGIPTISIYVGTISDMQIALGSAADSMTEVLGTLAVGGMQVDLKGGSVYIMAH